MSPGDSGVVTMETSQLHYTSPNHPTYLITAINSLRQNQDLCDVTLCVGDCSITAHRLVLCACSPYFNCLFTLQTSKNQDRNVILPGFYDDALKLVIEFFYTSAICITEENVWKLFPTACTLQVEELENVSRDFLLSNLQVDNALKTYLVAEETDCCKLRPHVHEFVCSNFKKILKDRSFCEVTSPHFVKVLISLTESKIHSKETGDESDTSAVCLSKTSALTMCIAWLRYKLEDRLPFVPEILKNFPEWKEKLVEVLPKDVARFIPDQPQENRVNSIAHSENICILLKKNGENGSRFHGKFEDHHGNDHSNHADSNYSNRNGSGIHGNKMFDSTHDSMCCEVDSDQINGLLRCMFCDEMFASQWELEIHMKTHSTSSSKIEKHFQLIGHQNVLHDKHRARFNGSFILKTQEPAQAKGANADSVSDIKGENSLCNTEVDKSVEKAVDFDFSSFCAIPDTDDKQNPTQKCFVKTELESNSLSQVVSVSDLNCTHIGENGSLDNMKKFGCPHCDVVEDQNWKLMKHISDMHSGDAEFTCNVCDRSYSSRSNLQIHMRTHSGERPFTCDQCSKSFSSVCVLRVHQRTHTGERPFSCPTCGVAFAKNIHLKRHLSIHTGEKPHECSICHKRFSRSDHLKRHIQSIHSNSRPHVCALCAKDFVRKYELNKHMKTHHSGLGLSDDSGIVMDIT